MKTAIVYTSHHGTTGKIAREIASRLSVPDTEIFDLKKHRNISVTGYGMIIIGGSIHAGKISGRLRKFLQRNMHGLLNTRIAFFVCCMNEPGAEKQFEDQFPELLRNHSVSNKIAGGEFLFEKMNIIEKFLVRKISGIKSSVSKIDDNKIDELVNTVKIYTGNY